MSWQRLARAAIVLATLGFLVVVARSIRHREVPRPAAPVPQLDRAATIESEGGVTRRLSGPAEDLRIDYDRLLSFPDGASRMQGLRIVSTRVDGRIVTIHAHEGRASADDANVELTGEVRLQGSDGTTMEGAQAVYAKADRRIRVPDHATFAGGAVEAAGDDVTYDEARDALRIGHLASVHVHPDAQGQGGLQSLSGIATYVRPAGLLQFESGATVDTDEQRLQAESMTATLHPETQRLQRIELRGGPTVTRRTPLPGSLRSLAGHEVDLTYRADGHTLDHATVRGDAVLEFAGDPGQPPRQLRTALLDIGFTEDGTAPASLLADGRVSLVMPPHGAVPARTIASDLLNGTGTPQGGVQFLTFTRNVRFSERGREVSRDARAGQLTVSVAAGFGDVDDARFSDAVSMDDGSTSATAAAVRYRVATGILELSGTSPSRPAPRVTTPQMTIDAAQIRVVFDGPVIEADVSVRSRLAPAAPSASARRDAPVQRLPGLVRGDGPVNITADQLRYDGQRSLAVYRGHARLWHGDTSVRGTLLQLDGVSGDLLAEGSVTTQLPLTDRRPGAAPRRVTSAGSADQFTYADALRRALYVGQAHVTGPQGDVRAREIALYLQAAGDTLDRAEADGTVTLKGDGRTTTAAHLTFDGDTDVYRGTGTPARLVDACGRITEGRTLIFDRATDRITVDGRAGTRTTSSGIATCP